ncbi:MAG: hypothetical protein H5U40_10165, partial [Polyangiaceae bacterium]|nr:hypothetical protein [Polyangiaceae bacterium]
VHRHVELTAEQIRVLCGYDETPRQLMMLTRFEEFFAREIELGRMRPTNPATLSDMFIGAVVHQCHVRLYFGDYVRDDVDQFAQRLARDFFQLTCTAP